MNTIQHNLRHRDGDDDVIEFHTRVSQFVLN